MALGIDCKTYLKTGGDDATPSWTEADQVSDFMVDPSYDMFEVLTRQTKVKRKVPTLMECPVTGKIQVDNTDPVYAAMQAAFDAKTPVQLLVLDGPIETAGSRGYRADWNIEKFGDDQGPTVVRFKDFGLSPAVTSYLPKVAVAAGGGAITYAAMGG